MKKTFFAGLLFLMVALISFSAGAAESYEYPGKWKVKNAKSTYLIYLNLGGSAMSDKGAGQMGAWSFSGTGVRIAWMDGTYDSIQKKGAGYEKISGSTASPAEKVG